MLASEEREKVTIIQEENDNLTIVDTITADSWSADSNEFLTMEDREKWLRETWRGKKEQLSALRNLKQDIANIEVFATEEFANAKSFCDKDKIAKLRVWKDTIKHVRELTVNYFKMFLCYEDSKDNPPYLFKMFWTKELDDVAKCLCIWRRNLYICYMKYLDADFYCSTWFSKTKPKDFDLKEGLKVLLEKIKLIFKVLGTAIVKGGKTFAQDPGFDFQRQQIQHTVEAQFQDMVKKDSSGDERSSTNSGRSNNTKSSLVMVDDRFLVKITESYNADNVSIGRPKQVSVNSMLLEFNDQNSYNSQKENILYKVQEFTCQDTFQITYRWLSYVLFATLQILIVVPKECSDWSVIENTRSQVQQVWKEYLREINVHEFVFYDEYMYSTAVPVVSHNRCC